jgi:hypothetical protein
MATFNFISDPSHAWLEVDRGEYPDAINFSTGFGYINGRTIYLEEDVEAPAFLESLKAQGIQFDIVEKTYENWHGRMFARNPKVYVSGQ